MLDAANQASAPPASTKRTPPVARRTAAFDLGAGESCGRAGSSAGCRGVRLPSRLRYFRAPFAKSAQGIRPYAAKLDYKRRGRAAPLDFPKRTMDARATNSQRRLAERLYVGCHVGRAT